MKINNKLKIFTFFVLIIFIYFALLFLGVIKKCSDMNPCDSWRCKRVIEPYPCDKNNIFCPDALITKCKSKF